MTPTRAAVDRDALVSADTRLISARVSQGKGSVFWKAVTFVVKKEIYVWRVIIIWVLENKYFFDETSFGLV